MQPKAAFEAPLHEVGDHQSELPQPRRFGWSKFDSASALEPAPASERTLGAAAAPLSTRSEVVPSASESVAQRSTDFALPKDNTITISVIGGPSKGVMHQFSKPRISIGRAGGGADIELDDPKVSGLHCAVGISQNRVRLCDLDSTNGTYVNDERVPVAELVHLSEFRVGSSLLLVTILPKSEKNSS